MDVCCGFVLNLCLLQLAWEESRLKLNNDRLLQSRTKADGVVPLQSLTTLLQALSLLSPAAKKCSSTHSLVSEATGKQFLLEVAAAQKSKRGLVTEVFAGLR